MLHTNCCNNSYVLAWRHIYVLSLYTVFANLRSLYVFYFCVQWPALQCTVDAWACGNGFHIPWRSRITRACPGYGKVETRGPGWVDLGTWAPPKVVCGRFVTYIYCYKRPHVWNMHLGAALCQPRRPLLFPHKVPTRACPG